MLYSLLMGLIGFVLFLLLLLIIVVGFETSRFIHEFIVEKEEKSFTKFYVCLRRKKVDWSSVDDEIFRLWMFVSNIGIIMNIQRFLSSASRPQHSDSTLSCFFFKKSSNVLKRSSVLEYFFNTRIAKTFHHHWQKIGNQKTILCLNVWIMISVSRTCPFRNPNTNLTKNKIVLFLFSVTLVMSASPRLKLIIRL